MTRDPFGLNTPLIAASILSADFAKLGEEIAYVDRAGADFLHLDIMDGHFVPNISFGPAVARAARKATDAYLDAHLMISEPLRYGPPLARAGANNITFHVEVTDEPPQTARQLRKTCTDAAQRACQIGITLNPATPLESILPALEDVDIVLVMSVVPGFSGQQFMEEALPKCQAIKKRLRADQRLEIDGGISDQSIRRARDAGVDWFVAASAIFDAADRSAAIADLRAQLQR